MPVTVPLGQSLTVRLSVQSDRGSWHRVRPRLGHWQPRAFSLRNKLKFTLVTVTPLRRTDWSGRR